MTAGPLLRQWAVLKGFIAIRTHPVLVIKCIVLFSNCLRLVQLKNVFEWETSTDF